MLILALFLAVRSLSVTGVVDVVDVVVVFYDCKDQLRLIKNVM